MSKKFEVIRNAVFYSQQEPEKLAKLLEGTISDVATSVTVAGDSSVVIPLGDTATTKTYTASVLSQYGDVMDGQSITYSVTSATGVSINSGTGVLSVGKTASAGDITVTATSGGKSGTITVSLVAQVVTSVAISGDDSIEIPSGDTATEKTYTATVKNQFDETMEGQSVTWSIPETTGVSIGSSTGVLEVAKTASAGKVTITATCSEKTATKEVTLTAGT